MSEKRKARELMTPVLGDQRAVELIDTLGFAMDLKGRTGTVGPMSTLSGPRVKSKYG